MTRLYYDMPPNVVKTMSGQQKSKQYLVKVAKLVPVEIVTAFTAAISIIPAIADPTFEKIALIIIYLTCLIGTPLYMNQMAEVGKPKRAHIIVSTLAFLFWSYHVSGPILSEYINHNAGFSSVLLIAFSVISGKVPLN